MTAPTEIEAPPTVSTFEMYRSLVGVGIACGLLIVTVFEITKPIIAENRAEALREAVFTVIPAAESSATFALTEGGQFNATSEERPAGPVVYAGYDGGGDLVGVALRAQGMGYQDVITILYGYSFEKKAIVGIQVLESKETPGLGDKIEKDEKFLANFEALDVQLDDSGQALAHPIEAVKSGTKEQPWQVDGITGATISSVAIAHMLRDSAAQWVPLLEKSRDTFADGEPQND